MPNIKDADRCRCSSWRKSINALDRHGPGGQDDPGRHGGGTLTITNVGVFGVDTGTPILNPGESAIVCLRRGAAHAVGRRHRRDEQIEPRWVTQLAVSFDHRLVDGAAGLAVPVRRRRGPDRPRPRPAVTRYRVRAPELASRGGWFNTGGQRLSLADLRGRIVLLDFWTAGCANCWHVLDELRPLEREYADVLSIIGVHSPKFAHEGLDESVAAAVERYEVPHAVLSDPDMAIWQQYAIKAWPTLVLIDPAGYVVAQAAGEGQVSGLAKIIDELIFEFGDRLRRGDDPYGPPSARRPSCAFRPRRSGSVTRCWWPTPVIISWCASDGDGTVLERIGAGTRGHQDGPTPSFAEPSGLTRLPDGRIVVADSANHALRIVDGASTTTAQSTNRGLRTITGDVPDVLSPADVAWWPAIGQVVVAAAGVHLLLGWDPATDAVTILAGTTVEGVRDGDALDAWLAQPSGLAVDGERIWFVDAESSTLRTLDAYGVVRTSIGEGLFDFGHVDGPAATPGCSTRSGWPCSPTARSRSPTPTTGRSAASTNGVLTTIATGLAEPSGMLEVDGELVVVESAAHRLRPITPATTSADQAMPATRPVTALAAGEVTLIIEFTPPPGRKLDERDGPSTRLSVAASPPSLLLDGGGTSTALTRTIILAPGAGVLNVTAQAAACDEGGDNPACYLSRQDWGVPIEVADGASELRLVLMA